VEAELVSTSLQAALMHLSYVPSLQDSMSERADGAQNIQHICSLVTRLSSSVLVTEKFALTCEAGTQFKG
jgi:hypothetical protein